jgi:hypothetical protein
MSVEILQSAELLWTVVGLMFFAFVVGVRFTYGVTVESKRMQARIERHIALYNSVYSKQQEEINYVLKRVNDVMHSGKVKRITIKRKSK